MKNNNSIQLLGFKVDTNHSSASEPALGDGGMAGGGGRRAGTAFMTTTDKRICGGGGGL